MPAELLALAAATLFAAGLVAVKFATQTGNMLHGFLISLAAGAVAVGAVAVVTVETWEMPLGVAGLFALAGVIGSGLGRILSIRGVRDAGASVHSPVQSSANPVVASAAGVLVFGETVGLGRVLALALIVSGIWACVRGGSANREIDAAGRPSRVRWLVLFWPVAAGTAYAMADTLKKVALAEHGDPMMGAFIGVVTAFVIWLAILLLSPQLRKPIQLTRSLGWFCLSGVLTAAATVALLFALRVGDLSVVAPIVASQPVLVILLGVVLLRDLEKLRVGTVVGAVIVFVGVAYLALT